jgi:adenosylcobinamide-GDP ribazoletransferase
MRAALAFLTALGGARPPSRRAVGWFPVVGAFIGAVVGGVWWGAGRVWPALAGAAVAVAADAALTGLLHLDGLADSADGLLPHLARDRRLEVMAEPRIGAFGAATLAIALILRTSALASMHPDVRLVAALWCASRTHMATIMGSLPYARGEGLATVFGEGGHWATTVYGLAGAVALAAWWHPVRGVGAVAAGTVAAAAVAALARRRVGGFTGDVLGAAGVVGETVGLLVAAIGP